MRDLNSAPPVPMKADICIIGAGSAGLSVAAGAAQMGARTVLIEADRMGGDCLNTGCVPSKSLLAAAKTVHTAQDATRFGIRLSSPEVDFARVGAYVRGVIANIAPHDSVERFTELGCTVIKARARFVDDRTIEADGTLIRARRFVIATGSRASVPPIPGLADVPYMTNETVFDNAVLPRHLVIIGAGPIGCEMAQAHQRLGSQVTVLDLGSMLPKDDPDAVAVIRNVFAAENVAVMENVKILRVEKRPQGIVVALTDGEGVRLIEGTHLLVATGRAPNVDALGLESAGIRFGPKGIEVDAGLRSTNRRVYAAGDVAGSYQFTHLAGYHAGIILRSALFRLPARTDLSALPWATYTDPELAQVGMTEAQARQAYGDRVRVLRADFVDNDRAQADCATKGFIKVMVSKRGKVLGTTIVGRNAGEFTLPWGLAMSRGLGVGALTTLIAPYPTFGEINKRVAGQFYASKIFNWRTRALVRLLGCFG